MKNIDSIGKLKNLLDEFYFLAKSLLENLQD